MTMSLRYLMDAFTITIAVMSGYYSICGDTKTNQPTTS
ncbi:hypothetical protein Mame_02920 [Martelella mediterranea DSM 17316]|uniref:Uncharacterized protein n=1 Tax=Martelella mediterranea DSM 17316 TaxID=1122214 RepID=A0A1U9Z3G7_9HYPH|nr:hypothetical protein Mame_02920 [Martelella mediterranea DSM 17316]